MKVLYKWLREFVDTDLSAEEIAEGLTMAGMEVAAVQRVGCPSTDVKVGLIKEIRPHSDSNLRNLIVCRVHVGDGDLQIVTGDLSLKVGDLAAVALPGAELPKKKRIEVVDFKGELSQGMLCALTEILLGEPHRENEGVFVLGTSPAVRPGMDLAELLGWDDYLLELELTPNYVHCLSLVGVAMEVASIGGEDLTPLGEKLWYTWRPYAENGGRSFRRGHTDKWRAEDAEKGKDAEEINKGAGEVKVVIENPHLCGRYSARVIDGIKTVPSDPLVQWRLVMVDQRPINNIVDATNYAMIETGQPMHAFDYDLIRDNTIVVRTARRGESIETLDGVKRDLDEEMLVISDGRNGDRAVAIAGVMGGSDTEISASTTAVLLESAFFAPESVGATSRKLGLKSEASMRFEKGVDPLGTIRAIERFEEVLRRTGGYAAASALVDECPVSFKPAVIDISPSYINRLLGTRLSPLNIKRCLCGLGFEVKEKGKRGEDVGSEDEGPAVAGLTFEVLVPTRRVDVKREVDLVEEVGRAAGLDRIPATLPVGCITVGE
ncbi:MAG TPA: phenylalanine--tRNA ligase subunit beta, partial [Clostridia bacterium]|nr:phenylalanine--tRNA ligase subunit beta [Clostridia bacterium]